MSGPSLTSAWTDPAGESQSGTRLFQKGSFCPWKNALLSPGTRHLADAESGGASAISLGDGGRRRVKAQTVVIDVDDSFRVGGQG